MSSNSLRFVLSIIDCKFAFVFLVYYYMRTKLSILQVQYTHYTWSVQKISRILNFRGLRIFDFRFFCGVMLVLISRTYADKFGHFECSGNF